MIERGGIFWADLGPVRGSRPAKRRPVVVVQADPLNASRIGTVVAAAVTSYTEQAGKPGNVYLPAAVSGLPKDSVVNVTALTTFDRDELDGPVGRVPLEQMREVDAGLRAVLAL